MFLPPICNRTRLQPHTLIEGSITVNNGLQPPKLFISESLGYAALTSVKEITLEFFIVLQLPLL